MIKSLIFIQFMTVSLQHQIFMNTLNNEVKLAFIELYLNFDYLGNYAQ